MDDVPSKTCRICYEPGGMNEVCECKGSMQYVHRECIEHWIGVSHKLTCELCHAPFCQSVVDAVIVERPVHGTASPVYIVMILSTVVFFMGFLFCLIINKCHYQAP